jgi:hypothetical protein
MITIDGEQVAETDSEYIVKYTTSDSADERIYLADDLEDADIAASALSGQVWVQRVYRLTPEPLVR